MLSCLDTAAIHPGLQRGSYTPRLGLRRVLCTERRNKLGMQIQPGQRDCRSGGRPYQEYMEWQGGLENVKDSEKDVGQALLVRRRDGCQNARGAHCRLGEHGDEFAASHPFVVADFSASSKVLWLPGILAAQQRASSRNWSVHSLPADVVSLQTLKPASKRTFEHQWDRWESCLSRLGCNTCRNRGYCFADCYQLPR